MKQNVGIKSIIFSIVIYISHHVEDFRKKDYVLENPVLIIEVKIMIDIEKTISLRGYDPLILKPKSDKSIWAICNKCSKGRWSSMGGYCNLCHQCSVEKIPKPKFVPESERFIFNTGIDRIKTIEEKGYDPNDLKPKSDKRVWSICQECGDSRWLSMGSYHDLCHKCGNKTEDHIKNMSESHKGIKPSKECCEKRSKAMKGKNVGEENGNWQGGASIGIYCPLFNDRFKEKIRNMFNRLCFLCGMNEEENTQKLSVHHVNQDKNCLCGPPCDFVPLCRGCHSKMHGKNIKQYWEDTIVCYLHPNRVIMIDI